MSGEEEFVAFITKYALTKGILEARVRRFPNYPDIVSPVGNSYAHFHGADWHRSWVSAADKAEEMRLRKIASLKAQISKLEKLRFSS